MKVTAALIAFAVAVYGQSTIPTCAQSCFLKAIAVSGCGLTDTYCQCTTGQAKIAESVIPCLCTSTCSKAELAEVQKDSAAICSSALQASGMTYTAVPAPTNACAAASKGTTAAATTSMSAKTSSSAMMSSSTASTSSTSAPVASGNYAPAATHMGVQGVLLGVAGLAMAAL